VPSAQRCRALGAAFVGALSGALALGGCLPGGAGAGTAVVAGLTTCLVGAAFTFLRPGPSEGR